jgi:hypothetical protein
MLAGRVLVGVLPVTDMSSQMSPPISLTEGLRATTVPYQRQAIFPALVSGFFRLVVAVVAGYCTSSS